VAQRIFAARTERDGLLATLWFNIAHYAVRPWPWILVALASTLLYPGLENPREGYVRAILDLLPPGITGLVLAGFAAAYMSTISTQLNWGASYLVNDLYARFLRPEASQQELVRVSRGATLFLMLASLVVTLFLTSIEGAWRFLLALGAGTGLVLILRWYWWRINAWSEISAMVASLVTSLILWFGVGLDPDNLSQWAIIMLATVAVSTLTWITVTFLTRPESDTTLDTFYRRVRPGGRGWRGVAIRNGFGAEGVDGGALNWTNWVAGVVSVYASLFGVGRLLFGEWIEARKGHRKGKLNVGDLLTLATRWAQQYDQDGNPKGNKIETQAEADAVPRNVTIGFYGPISLSEGSDPAWIEAAEQAYRDDQASERQQRAIPISEGDDFDDEFGDDDEVPF
jgi:hypothetical protein